MKRRMGGQLQPREEDVEEEKKLTLANEKSDSIIDEEVDSPFISPVLAKVVLRPRSQREKEEEGKETEADSLLTKSDLMHLSRELKRPVSFSGLKKSGNVESSNVIKFEELNIDELLRYAEAHG